MRGELRPGGTEREWCDPDVLRRLRRASLAALRKEVEPAEQAAFARFLASWHGVDRRSSLREALVPLQALALPVSLWESELLPRRVPDYRPEQLDQLCATGELVWVGAGLDRVAVYFREDAAVLGAVGGSPRPDGEVHDAIRGALSRSAEFWSDLLAVTGLEAEQALPALWDLVWAGEVTNDAWQPLRAPRRYGTPKTERRPRRFARRRACCRRRRRDGGRWRSGCSPSPSPGRSLAELLLERQGIVTRDGVRAEGIPGGYGAVYSELRALETLGLCRRGYFVEGLGGAQFALGGAVERLRELRPREGEEPQPLVLAAADPAQPYGAGPSVAEAGDRPCGPRGRGDGRAARRRACALRRARREDAAAAARPRGRLAPSGPDRARRAHATGRQAPTAGGRALRWRAGGRVHRHADPPRGRLRGRAAARRASALTAMPEGDTVHRTAARLRVLVGQRLTVEAVHPRARATGVAERLDGRRLEAVEAHGKNLLLRFEGGRVLRSHLGMSGSWRTMAPDAPVRGTPWLVLTGERAKAVLRGGAVLETSARRVSTLGPDILAPELDGDGDRRESPAHRPAASDRRSAPRPARGGGHREHLAQRGAVARSRLAVVAPRRHRRRRAARRRARGGQADVGVP